MNFIPHIFRRAVCRLRGHRWEIMRMCVPHPAIAPLFGEMRMSEFYCCARCGQTTPPRKWRLFVIEDGAWKEARP